MKYIIIKELKYKLTALRELLEYENKIKEIRNIQKRRKSQKKSEKELNELKTKKDEELEYLETSMNCEKLWRRNFEDDFNISDEIELSISRIEESIRKREVELENLCIIEHRYIDLLMELDINKNNRQEELILIEIKYEKLNISEKTIKAIRSQYLD